MRFWEVLKLAIDEGKKIRLTQWNPKEFIYWNTYDKRFHVFSNSAEYIITSDLFVEDWEIYEPVVKFGDLKPGDRFKMLGLNNKTVYHKIASKDNNVIWFDGYDEPQSDRFDNHAEVVAI